MMQAGMTSEHQQGISEAELLHSWLSSRDVPCPVCGYSLRSIESATCPECGAQLDIRVGSTDLRIGLWLACVISQALAMGFVGLWAILVTIPALFAGQLVALIVAAVTVGYMVALWRLILRRKKFWSKPRHAQMVSVVLYILASTGVVTIPIAIWFVELLF